MSEVLTVSIPLPPDHFQCVTTSLLGLWDPEVDNEKRKTEPHRVSDKNNSTLSYDTVSRPQIRDPKPSLFVLMHIRKEIMWEGPT